MGKQPFALHRVDVTQKAASRWQKAFLVGLCIGDLIDDQSHTALGDDVRGAVANLNANNCMGSIDAKHGEQVHNRVCAPTDHGPHLGSANLAGNDWVSLTVSGPSETDKQTWHQFLL